MGIKRFLILLFFPLTLSAQIDGIGNIARQYIENRIDAALIETNLVLGSDSVTIRYKLIIDTLIVNEVLLQERCHVKSGFKDSSVAITGGSYVQITNASDSLFNIDEVEKIGYIGGDTFQIIHKGGYFVFFGIGGSGLPGADWRLMVAHRNEGTVYYSELQAPPFSTTGGANYDGKFLAAYFEFDVGDKVWLVLSRIGGTGDYTVRAGTFSIFEYYLE